MKTLMRPAYHVEITTPKNVTLDGLWLGPVKAKRVVIWIHGLGSSLFSKLPIADEIIDRDTAVLAFNNRGHDKIASIARGKKRISGGSAHEIFTDCADDIEGAVRSAKSAGAKEIFLAGHSTGCQKSIYWAAKKGKGVKGIFLLAPISDRAAEIQRNGRSRVERALRAAKALVKKGKPHELLPSDVWNENFDAQRFLSLCGLLSAEEIFPYWDTQIAPKTLHKVKIPIMALLAEKDEFNDRPARQMESWFAEHLKLGDKVVIVPKLGHSFAGGEKQVAQLMRRFMKEAVQ